MGLAVVHGIVREYEGRILVDSMPGQGARFWVYLPEVEAEEITRAGATALPQGRERLILVDDNTALLAAGQEMLTYLGYTVELFSDPREALARICSGPRNFQGVITDYIMPGMDGVDLAGKILAHAPSLPVILCTGNNRNLDFDLLLHSGIRSILIKPLVLEELAPALKAALKKEIANPLRQTIHP